MSKLELEKLIKEGLSTYEMSVKLECSQTNVRYWLRKYGLNTLRSSCSEELCLCCGAALKGRQRKYCSHQCKMTILNCAANTYSYQQNRGKSRRLSLIKMHGGKCINCGYSRNSAGLLFHHRDPNNKCYSLDMRKCSNTRWLSLVEESNKCDLVCHNCHMEMHYPSYEMLT